MTDTLARVRALAGTDLSGERGELERGVTAARLLRDDEVARELVLRAQGWAWSPEKLMGFLEIHGALVRNWRCSCHCCPIHDDLERPIDSNAD